MPKSQSQITITADSTQLTDFLTCPRLYYLHHVEHLEPRLAKPNIPMTLGSLGHFYLDHYYKLRSMGSPSTAAIVAALAQDPNGHVQNFDALESTSIKALHQRLFQYTLAYGQEHDFTIPSPACSEVGFSHTLYEDDNYRFILEGRIDLIHANWLGVNSLVDHKFQMRASPLYEKAIQFRNYALVAMETGHPYTTFVINYIRLTESITNLTFQRKLINFTAHELLGWKAALIRIFWQLTSAETYEQNWSACPGHYNSPCIYTPVCNEFDPLIANQRKEQLFQIKPESEVWHPWVALASPDALMASPDALKELG